MECTGCRTRITPVFVSDIDGTLSDYHEPFTKFGCRFHNRPIPNEPWDGKGEFEDYMGLTKAEYREAKLAYRQGGGKRLQPVYRGAKGLVDIARELGCEIWLTTTRPWNRFDSTDPDTRHWLDKHSIPYDHLLYDDDKYERLAERVDRDRVILVIEDLHEQYLEARDLFGNAVMIERPHNAWVRKNFFVGQHTNLLTLQGALPGLVDQWKAEFE
jgi:hypothetical protein